MTIVWEIPRKNVLVSRLRSSDGIFPSMKNFMWLQSFGKIELREFYSSNLRLNVGFCFWSVKRMVPHFACKSSAGIQFPNLPLFHSSFSPKNWFQYTNIHPIFYKLPIVWFRLLFGFPPNSSQNLPAGSFLSCQFPPIRILLFFAVHKGFGLKKLDYLREAFSDTMKGSQTAMSF